jgi:hypothetical protein
MIAFNTRTAFRISWIIAGVRDLSFSLGYGFAVLSSQCHSQLSEDSLSCRSCDFFHIPVLLMVMIMMIDIAPTVTPHRFLPLGRGAPMKARREQVAFLLEGNAGEQGADCCGVTSVTRPRRHPFGVECHLELAVDPRKTWP